VIDMNKKSSIFIFAVLSVLLLLGACGKNKVTNPPAGETNTPVVETNTGNNGTTTGTGTTNDAQGSKYGFTSFELDVDTANHKDAIGADYDEDPTDIEAEYENKVENIKLIGDAAMEKLDSIFKGLSLTYEMPNEEVIKKVSDTFGITDYTSFDLKIKFKDHEEKVYNVKK
jgi:hypothetical protein